MHNVKWNKERVLEGLRSEAKSREFADRYEILKGREPIVARFASPEALIGTLIAPRGASYDDKDGIIHALVRAIQTRPEISRCAQVLLSLAMWPALEHSYYKLLPLASRLPDLFAEIHWRFLEEVAAHDLAKRFKLAVNLQLNAEKRVKRAAIEEDRYQDFLEAHAILSSETDHLIEEPESHRIAQLKDRIESARRYELKRCLRAAASERCPDQYADAMAAASRHWEMEGMLAAEERKLVAEHAIYGVPIADIASELGISAGAARVRYHRAKRKLEARME